MKEQIILVGGGGHCRSVIDILDIHDKYQIAGIVDIKEKLGDSIAGYKYIATDEELKHLVHEYKYFLITIGQIQSNEIRVKLYNKIKEAGGIFPVIKSPLSYVAPSAVVNEGTVIMHHAIINTGASIGKNCIINTSATVEHEAMVGSHCHISTGAVVNGGCNVESNCFIGSNAVLSQGILLREFTIIGAGSVVLTSTKGNCLYVGNPAKLKKRSS